MIRSGPDAPAGPCKVFIDCFPESASRYVQGYAVVVIDVIRATTTAVTAAARGQVCYPVPSVEYGVLLAQELHEPLLAGEVGGNKPYGFDITNSPAEVARRTDLHRPMVLVSSSGTKLIHQAAPSGAVLLASFRNVRATVAHLASRYRRVAVIGAGTRGEFREEDACCCARVAEGLFDLGYEAGNETTTRVFERWHGQPDDAWLGSRSVDYLRRTGQEKDLEFVLAHFEDLDSAYRLNGMGAVIQLADADGVRPPASAVAVGTDR